MDSLFYKVAYGGNLLYNGVSTRTEHAKWVGRRRKRARIKRGAVRPSFDWRIFTSSTIVMVVVVAAAGCWKCCDGMLVVAPVLTVAPQMLVLSRSDFLLQASAGILLFSSIRPAPAPPPPPSSSSVTTIPLQFLPVAGCLAVSIAFLLGTNGGRPSNNVVYRYSVVVDTASPFLTAPPAALDFTRDASRMYPSTQEQYGETVGRVQWRRGRGPIRLGVPRQQQQEFVVANRNLVMGVTPENLMQATGGLFCGLMLQDDNRPSLLEQLDCQSFILDYAARQLTFLRRGTSPSQRTRMESTDNTGDDDNTFLEGVKMMDMYDLSPYGPNLHHYCVPCSGLTLLTKGGTNKTISLSSLKRDVVVVIDSGLTGCVMSDSWEEESLPISSITDDIQGMDLQLGDGASVQLQSDPNYWTLTCFRLPWFTSESDHPHIIAAGATFLVGSKVVVDAQRRRLGVTPRTTTAITDV